MRSLSFTYIQSSSHSFSDLALLLSPASRETDQNIHISAGLLHDVDRKDPVPGLLEGLHHHVAQPALTSVHHDLARHLTEVAQLRLTATN